MDENLQKLVDIWLCCDKNESTRDEVFSLVEAKNFTLLRKLMEGSLSFGTAGVRARMGAGFTRLNDLTILQLSHGMAQHLLKEIASKGENKIPQIVIGFDGRHNSKRFADLAANVFVQNRIRTRIFSEVVPTPIVSFAVVELKCDAGLMITASHNPKEDNGFKVYWNNGAQILAPHDEKICEIVNGRAEPKAGYWKLDFLNSSPLLDSADSILDSYFLNESSVCCFYKDLNKNSTLKIAYSAFHGVGSKFARRMFSEFGFPVENIFCVKEQDEPDPDFPTVQFPNPEEGHKVLKLCFETADLNGATVVLANDPDADRLQLAERQLEDGQWRVFSGNEMGILLTWWIWTQWRQRNGNVSIEDVFVLNSAVSSQMVATMAKFEGFQNELSLTGFKWIGNLMHKLRSAGKHVILAWEESIGFTTGTTLDKDGISAAAVFAELANWLSTQNPPLSLQEQLFRLYNLYGFHLARNSYWVMPSDQQKVTKQLFAELRSNHRYPNKVGNVAVKFVRDLTTGFDSSRPNNKAVLPLSTSSEMITFTLDNGSVITLRASGTEPKIKYYIELCTEPGKTEKDLADVENELNQLEKDVVQTLLQPEKFGLISR